MEVLRCRASSQRATCAVGLLVVLTASRSLLAEGGSATPPPSATSPSAIPSATPATPPSASASTAAAPPPLRHSGTRLAWDPAFDRMDAPEMVLTGVAGAVAVTMNILRPLHTGWSGGILFDDGVRAIRAPSYNDQLEVRQASTLGLALITTYPILVDSLLVAYWYRGSDDVALQMALIDVEAFAITGALQGTASMLAGRARPYAYECGTGVPSSTTDCSSQTLDRSFFSGHTSGAFTAAGLICAHHEALQLFETPADHAACAAGLLAAAAIGTMRIVGDAHYFSDVFVGAVVGSAVGFGVPLLHHYKRAAPGETKSTSLRLSLAPGPTGAQLVGIF